MNFSKFLAASIVVSMFCAAQMPRLNYVRTLRGTAQDTVAGIATDPNGNVYVAGTTFSNDFPTANAMQPSPRRQHDI
jgi:hypothetical protein